MKSQKKKKNQLSLWDFPYRRVHYITHPWKLIRDIILNVKNMWHRARYGFAYTDVWNFCDWYPRVGAAALEYLALHKNSYPGVKPWETPEEWEEYLHYLARRLERCADSQDICFGEERNEYRDEFDEIMKRTRVIKEDKCGTILSHKEFTPEEEEIKNKYWAREEEIRKADQEYIEQTYKWISEDLSRLWD